MRCCSARCLSLRTASWETQAVWLPAQLKSLGTGPRARNGQPTAGWCTTAEDRLGLTWRFNQMELPSLIIYVCALVCPKGLMVQFTNINTIWVFQLPEKKRSQPDKFLLCHLRFLFFLVLFCEKYNKILSMLQLFLFLFWVAFNNKFNMQFSEFRTLMVTNKWLVNIRILIWNTQQNLVKNPLCKHNQNLASIMQYRIYCNSATAPTAQLLKYSKEATASSTHCHGSRADVHSISNHAVWLAARRAGGCLAPGAKAHT